jgi:hypothetical protein
VFTELLPSNEKTVAHIDTQIDGRDVQGVSKRALQWYRLNVAESDIMYVSMKIAVFA